jgi:hypothetical protein
MHAIQGKGLLLDDVQKAQRRPIRGKPLNRPPDRSTWIAIFVLNPEQRVIPVCSLVFATADA